jgi:hypothetical protein
MKLPRLLRRAVPLGLVCCAWGAQAQFNYVPPPERGVERSVSLALNEKAYRQDAARHVYASYPSRIKRGMMPPLLHAIMVTETEIDAHGAVRSVRVVRAPAAAKEVGPWVVSLIRSAAPYPPPQRMGSVRFTEIWLVDKSGLFQVDTLTEGQL